MDAFNRRDMAEVNRAVAAASGSAAETVASAEGEGREDHQQNGATTRSCTDGKEGEDVEGERVVRRKLNIDNSDDGGPLSDVSEEGPDTEHIPTELLLGGIPEEQEAWRKSTVGQYRILAHQVGDEG